MRVVYVSTLDGGGPVSHLLDLAPAVANLGLDVSVICQSDVVADRFRDLGIVAAVGPVRSKWDVRAVADLRRLVAGADVVHSQDRRAGLFARIVSRAAGSRVVHTYHGLPEDIAVRVGRGHHEHSQPAMPRRLWLFGIYLPIEALLARLGEVVVPSAAMARYLATVGIPTGRLHVIPSGIDVRRTSPPPARSPLVIATAANLEHWKGIDVLLDAVARLDRPAHLDVYGDGADRAALEAQARRAASSVTFHGRVSDVRERLLDADVFVLPSRAENLPIAILEAMAAALPVVATRVGGVPELVVDGQTGLVVEPDDAVALANALRQFVDNEDQRVTFGEAGALRASTSFRAEASARLTVELYENSCASSR